MPLAKRRSEQENVFTTNNTRPNQKINRFNLESERTHFDIGFNNGNLQCTVRPLFFFHTKPHQSTAKSITKTTNRNNQSNQTIRKNKAPQPLNQKHPKTNTTSNYDTMQCFLNIKISQTATASEPTANTPFIKTQRKYTRLNNITYTLR